MKQRGRKSAAALTVVNSELCEAIKRPDAPYDLTDEEAEEWWAVVNRMPADWFPRETHGMLAQYCRHVVRARRVAQLVQEEEKLQGFDLDRYDQLLKMQERESRIMSSLATRMRISQQATVRAESARKPPVVKPPWQPDDE